MNAGDHAAQKKARQREAREREQNDNDFRWLMNDPRGRRFLWRMIGRCRVFQLSYDAHGGRMNFNEGQREVGLFLLGQINELTPELYAVMAGENAPQPQEEPNHD